MCLVEYLDLYLSGATSATHPSQKNKKKSGHVAHSHFNEERYETKGIFSFPTLKYYDTGSPKTRGHYFNEVDLGVVLAGEYRNGKRRQHTNCVGNHLMKQIQDRPQKLRFRKVF
ncbi:MAG: hypothetical protein ACE5FU_12600 [Nitrospinota bacterium]